jgi:ATP-binding cassette subfamily F protein uup
MNYLQLENVSKSYGEKILLDNISLIINKGDKIGLVAKNGSGKSTLLRLIAGYESPEGETARITLNKNIKLAILEQEPQLNDQQKLIDAIFDSNDPPIVAVRQYEEALLKNDSEKIHKAVSAMDNLKAWNLEARIKEILFKLKIPELEKQISQLSGGQKKRISLAKVILQDPDLLILDEPTNHLDMEMIEWLEEYFQSKNITLFMVTHDRYFLENTCNRIIELENGQLFIYPGNYESYLQKRTEKLYNENIAGEKLKKLLNKELEWLKRQPKARTTKSKSRSDKVYELKEKAQTQIYNDSISIDIETQRLGSKIIELYNICKSYGDIMLLDDFTYKFKRNEKIGIAGSNGTGKTTLANIICGQLKPDSGRVITGETVKFSIFTQQGISLDTDKRVLDVILDIAEYLPMANGRKLTAEQLLEKFLFSRSHQQVYVSQLSGGEKRRLQLLAVLMSNPNFLILDEPTNDLDIITLNILEEYLIGFKGNLLIITHDRYFMDKITDHIFILEGNGKVKVINSSLSEYRRQIRNTPKEEAKTPLKSEENRDLRSEKKKINNEISRILKKIEMMEKERKELLHYFESNPSPDIQEIEQKGKRLNELTEQVKSLETDWEEKMEDLEELETETQ